MADAYQIETSVDRYLMEDGLGVLLLEAGAGAIGAQSLQLKGLDQYGVRTS